MESLTRRQRDGGETPAYFKKAPSWASWGATRLEGAEAIDSIACKAAIAWKAGEPLKVENIEVASPKHGEVRVKQRPPVPPSFVLFPLRRALQTCGKLFQRATPREFVWFAARPESSEETRASLSPRFPPYATQLSDESYVVPSGTGMKPQFFYSATGSRRPRLVALEDADEMFVQLDNGNLSDVGDTEDDEDEDFIFEEAGSDDCALQT
ncbi:hypothetical protein HPB50_026403 [Hyalomma asiaticum]|uniref:Uncharacterized protein n=1 Tax=Hyalomma asiaticum TaxID=266040 RepID=A0ACB7SZZ4_HYAAI|nr:hypothetical protein HPB50_026403 [Hyalomma asiaticum]